VDRVVTKTLAEIYLRQGYYQEAYEMFKALSEKDPSDREVQDRLKALTRKMEISASRQGPFRSTQEKIDLLKRWLANIQ
jgi:hypothetical protein